MLNPETLQRIESELAATSGPVLVGADDLRALLKAAKRSVGYERRVDEHLRSLEAARDDSIVRGAPFDEHLLPGGDL